MKKISSLIISLAALLFVAVSCDIYSFKEQNAPHTPGEPDLEGCYGVFFPTQDLSYLKELDPSTPTVATISVKRAVSQGAISVPVEVLCDSVSVFVAESINFADGQEETTFDVTFPNAVIGTPYTCTVQVSDPQYASKYTQNPTFLTFSVTRVKWNEIGMARWRDDLIGPMYAATPFFCEVDDVVVFERADKPGYLKFKNPYGPNMTAKIFTELTGGVVTPEQVKGNCTDREVIVDATNPNKVYMPEQPLGVTISSGDGEAYVASLCDENGFAGYTEYGTLKDKIITFPTKGLLVPFENDYSYYYGNTNGMVRICLPGAVLTDYSISVESGFTEKGVLPVYFTTGTDVEKIRYAVYEGQLDDKVINEETAKLVAGPTATSTDIDADESGITVQDLTLGKTGIYTIIAVSIDNTGAGKSSFSGNLCYVKEGDEDKTAVKLHLGLESAVKYRLFNPQTTLEVWAFADSSDVVDLKMEIFKRIDYLTDPDGCEQYLKASKSVPEEILDAVNDEGYIDLATGLLPGTEYVLMVWASNGYSEAFKLSDYQMTEGDPLPIYNKYSIYDLDPDFLPKDVSVFAEKEFNLYATDEFKGIGMNEYFGKVKFSKVIQSEDDGEGGTDNYILASGLYIYDDNKGVFEDQVVFDFYEPLNVVYMLSQTFDEKCLILCVDPDGKANALNYFMAFIPVLDGYFALVSVEPDYFNATGIGYYADGGFWEWISNVILVDPSKDDNGLAPAKAAKLNSAVTMKLISTELMNHTKKFTPKNGKAGVEGFNNFVDAAPEAVGVKVSSRPADRAPKGTFKSLKSNRVCNATK